MDQSATTLRMAVSADLPSVQAIYAQHVLHGAGTFETEPPDLAEMTRRHADIVARGMPYLVAEAGDRVLGYAYAGPYRLRAAYRYTLEDSVYVSDDALGRGVGRRLLDRLVTDATALGYRQMLAVIGDAGNTGSIILHERAGFTHVGIMRSVGFKFDLWRDVLLMQRALGPGDATLPTEAANG